jgi:hypothetical protein
MKILNNFSFFIVIIFFGLLSCDLENPDIGIPVDDVITLEVTQNSILADGKSSMVLTAVLGEASDPNLQVTFITSRGTFLESAGENSYSTAASGKKATATLISADIVDEEVVVVASVAALEDASLVFKTSKTVSFTTAFPDDLLFSSSQTAISKSGLDNAVLTATLFKNIGVPSQDIKVNFKAIPLDTAIVSFAPFAFTGDDAMAITTVKSANLKPGKVAIVAETITQDGSMLSDTLEIIVND